MQNIRSTGTKPELIIVKELRRNKLTFSRNVKTILGKPDIVIANKRTIVFVHGCFWHSHSLCKKAKLPATNRPFWREKILGNIHRDRRVTRELRKSGWTVITIWECETKSPKIKSILNARLKEVVPPTVELVKWWFLV
jgi:DNA mismatch endonuclease (patch repair protein)